MNILLAGVGGQGTVLASKLLAQAAMEQGWRARTAETIGMAQRGGCVVSHVRIGDRVYSPLIPYGTADVILGFEPAEAVRCLPYLKCTGTVVAAKKAIKPVTASLSGFDYESESMLEFLNHHAGRVIAVDTDLICGALPFSLEQMQQTIRRRIPVRFHDMNSKALQLGEQAAREQMEKEI